METEQCRLRSKPAGLFNHLKKIRAFLKNRINIIGGRRSHNLPDSKQTKEYFGRYLPLVSLVTTPDLIRGLLFRKRKILLENNCRRRSGTINSRLMLTVMTKTGALSMPIKIFFFVIKPPRIQLPKA